LLPGLPVFPIRLNFLFLLRFSRLAELIFTALELTYIYAQK